MPTNHRRGPCRFCGKPVGKGKGLAERSARTGIWLAWHERCAPLGVRERANYAAVAREADKAIPSDFTPTRKPYYVDDDDE